jgi:hypothetical protein
MKPLQLILILLAGFRASAETLPQTTCPVDTEPIRAELYADLNGYRLFACSTNCLKQIKLNGRVMYLRLHAEGVTVEKSPNAPDGISGASKKNKTRR